MLCSASNISFESNKDKRKAKKAQKVVAKFSTLLPYAHRDINRGIKPILRFENQKYGISTFTSGAK